MTTHAQATSELVRTRGRVLHRRTCPRLTWWRRPFLSPVVWPWFHRRPLHQVQAVVDILQWRVCNICQPLTRGPR